MSDKIRKFNRSLQLLFKDEICLLDRTLFILGVCEMSDGCTESVRADRQFGDNPVPPPRPIDVPQCVPAVTGSGVPSQKAPTKDVSLVEVLSQRSADESQLSCDTARAARFLIDNPDIENLLKVLRATGCLY